MPNEEDPSPTSTQPASTSGGGAQPNISNSIPSPKPVHGIIKAYLPNEQFSLVRFFEPAECQFLFTPVLCDLKYINGKKRVFSQMFFFFINYLLQFPIFSLKKIFNQVAKHFLRYVLNYIILNSDFVVLGKFVLLNCFKTCCY